MLEVLYSTGMRRMELMHLQLHDIDEERGTVMIRQGKGKKDRMTAIGERAIKWVSKYLEEVRPDLVREPDCGTIFLTNLYEPFTPNRPYSNGEGTTSTPQTSARRGAVTC